MLLCNFSQGLSFLSLQVATSEAADLQVDFLHGYHGDSYPFDGAGGAVGHAFFPSDPAWAGGIHLDAEEEWVFRQPGGAMIRKHTRAIIELQPFWVNYHTVI